MTFKFSVFSTKTVHVFPISSMGHAFSGKPSFHHL
jgi:hypothetical protein